jgi:cation:H+ antiporter
MGLVTLALGLVAAGAGGAVFLRGVDRLAEHWRVGPAFMAATFAAFATSAPELAVAVSASIGGLSALAMGDALGSNVVNVALILGLAAFIAPVSFKGSMARSDAVIALIAPVLTGLLVWLGPLGRIDALLLYALFIVRHVVVLPEIDQGAKRVHAEALAPAATAGLLAGGLGLLFLAGPVITSSATQLVADWAIDPFVMGALITSFGTSIPELSTTIVASLKRRPEIGLALILGSSIFNGLFIVPTAAMIAPITVGLGDVAVALFFGLLVIGLLILGQGKRLSRTQGLIMLGCYAAFVALTIST